MGINVRVSSAKNLEGFLLAEAHISFAEAFISTLLNSDAYPHSENLQVDIRQAENADEGEVAFDGARGVLSVKLPQAWNPTEVDTHAKLNDHLVAFGCQVLANCLMLTDREKTLKELIGIERAVERATMFCRAGISRHRTLGGYVGQVSDWQHLVKRAYKRRDDAPHITPKPLPEDQTDDDDNEDTIGELRSHRDLSVSSIINQSLWDKAGWQGMLYGFSGPRKPPILGLIFDNEEMANLNL